MAAVPYSEYPVDVVRSARRRKTVQAQVVDGRIRVLVPARLSQAEIDAHVRNLVGRLDRRRQRRRHTGDVDLDARAAELCRRFDLPRPESVRWVTNQNRRWGSCTPATGEIRISHRLRPWPSFVLDYVLVHELTHLVELNHTPRFHQLVDRFPLAERAKGFLLAHSYRSGDPSGPDPTPGPGGPGPGGEVHGGGSNELDRTDAADAVGPGDMSDAVDRAGPPEVDGDWDPADPSVWGGPLDDGPPTLFG